MLRPLGISNTAWTAADLVERFGPIPLSRICHDPPPGLATEDDVLEIHARHDRLFELVEGTLVEKNYGLQKSAIGSLLCYFIGRFIRENDLGLATGASGMLRLKPGLVRIPDLTFISWQRIPSRMIPDVNFFEEAVDLVVEVISSGNTRQEMKTKLHDYFTADFRLVWYLYLQPREVHVFTSPDACTIIHETETLTGGEVLPGFELPMQTLFANLQSQRVDLQ